MEQIINNFHIIKNKMYAKVVIEHSNIITNSQWFVLCIIDKHPDFSIKDISKILSISSSAATQLVNGLVKKGYVIRTRNTKDKRGLHLIISPKGKKQIMVITRKHIQFAEKLFSPLNEKELNQYITLQNKIISKM